MPLGTDINITAAKAAAVEDILHGNTEITKYYTTIGTSSSLSGGMTAMLMGGGNNIAYIEAYLKSDADLENEADNLRSACEQSTELTGSIITVTGTDSMMGGMGGTGFEASVHAKDYQKVVEATNALMPELGNITGLVNIESDIATTLTKPDIEIDEAKVIPYISQGLNMTALGNEIYIAMMRGVDTPATLDGKTLYVEGIMGKVGTAEEIKDLRVSGGLLQPIKLGDIATVAIGEEPTYIRRYDQARSATITADITEKDVGAVNQAAQEKIDALSPEYNVTVTMGGVAEEMQGAFKNMLIAIIIAIVIAYAVVVIFFRSFLTPLIIMFSLPLASIGALAALLITGRTIDISALMGVLMLIGIVLSNAILLVALVEQLRKGGMSTFDALVQGGRTRLRPILMTALATMLALLPLSLGLEQGVLLAASLGTVVIGGLFTSTLLTLLVIPVIYSLVRGWRP